MTDSTLERQSDSHERWGPLQRHQLVLIVAASTLVTGWLLVTPLPSSAVLLAVAMLVAATPLHRGDTLAQWLVVFVLFSLRSRWSAVHVCLEGDMLTLGHRAQINATMRTLHHVGRLDLAGHYAIVTSQLRDLIGALSATSTGGHVTQLVTMNHDGATTTVSASKGGELTGWEVPTTVPLFGTVNGQRVLREGWRFVRTIDAVHCVGRITTFRPLGDHSLLEALQCTGTPSTLAVHYAIVPSSRAARIVGRAVHRRGVDESATRSLGFRRSAHADRTLARLAHREQAVAAGHTLLRVAAYVIISGETVRDVQRGVAHVTARASDEGTCVHWGAGRQARWFLWALPGGLTW